jgi:hypothetical protein
MAAPIRRSDVEQLTDDDGHIMVESKGSTNRLEGLTATVWQLIDGEREVAALAGRAGADESEVWTVIDRLADLGLLEGHPAPPGAEQADVHQLRTSRRRLIKFGAAAMAGGVVASASRGAAAASPAQEEERAKAAAQREQDRKDRDAQQAERKEKQSEEKAKK